MIQSNLIKPQTQINVQLEDRICPYCGITFRVMPSSPQVYHANQCREADGGKVLDPKRTWKNIENASFAAQQAKKREDEKRKVEMRERALKFEEKEKQKIDKGELEGLFERAQKATAAVVAKNDKVVELTKASTLNKKLDRSKMTQEEWNSAQAERWERFVVQARGIINDMVKKRLKVAALCMEACDIQHGGGNHWKGFKDVYTMKKFAEDIGITYKTLAQWVRIKRNVVDKLPEGLFCDTDWMSAIRTDAKVKNDTPKEQVEKEYRKERERGNDEMFLMQIIRKMRSTVYFLDERADFSKLDRNELMELHGLCSTATEKLEHALWRKHEAEPMDV